MTPHRYAGTGIKTPQNLGFCESHEQVEAIGRCARCKARVCAVCQFTFPGRLQVCPTCVANPGMGVTTHRKGFAIGGMACTVFSMAMLANVMFHVVEFSERETTQAGLYVVFLVFFPAAIGLVCSYGAMDKNRGNSGLLWTACIVSSLQYASLFLLILLK